MRITTEMLTKLTRDFVSQRTLADRDILAVYLHGSMLLEEYLIGGTTDIDLFIVHNDNRPESREIVRITDEIHFDIAHHPRSLYRHARDLRLHPWLGPTINGCKILYDPQHFLDFAQASVRGQFMLPSNVLLRARPLVEKARQIWLAFASGPVDAGPKELEDYLRAVAHAANGIASLVGAPLTERRFLIDFRSRAARLSHSGLYAGLLGLLGAPHLDNQDFEPWRAAWRLAYTSLPPDRTPDRLHTHRLPYYERAFAALSAESKFQDALWPLLRTWTESIRLLPEEAPHRPAWRQAGEKLGLLGPGFQERITALDAYLDLIEETLDAWAAANGA